MIKKIFLVLIFITCAQYLFGEFQLTYNVTNDKEFGTNHRIVSYFNSLSRSWLIENIMYGSYNGKNILDGDEVSSTEYYLINYIRHKISISYLDKKFLFNFFLAGEYDFGENFKTNIAGLPYQFVLKQGISSGIFAHMETALLKTELEISYDAKEYDYEEDDKNFTHTESNLIGKLRTGIALSKPLEIYAEVFHYDDLNKSDRFDYSSLYAGLEFDKKLNHIHYLTADAAVGYCNVDSLIPYNLHLDARLTSKLIHNWMFISRMTYNAWTDNDFDEFYVGKHFGEITLQKNFSFTPRNQVNNIQCSLAHYYLNNQTVIKGKVEWHFGDILCRSSYRHCFGNEVPYNNYVKAEIAYQLSQALRISYSYKYKDNRLIPITNAHTIGIDILL